MSRIEGHVGRENGSPNALVHHTVVVFAPDQYEGVIDTFV